MPLGPPAPYDTLATVTSLTRTILADYIAGLKGTPQGTVNVNGTAVTWVSGDQFTVFFNGTAISINGISYPVFAVNSPTALTLQISAGVQTGVAYVATIPTGDIFNDSEAYVLPTVNLAWRKLQKKLDNASHPRMRNEVDILALPVAASTDPATQQWISWTQFFDGVNTLTSPVLPQDFLSPMWIGERPSVLVGTNNSGFQEMHPVGNGLPSRVKGTRNYYWDWREDAIYFVGSMIKLDLRIQYQAFLADIAAAQAGFASTVIPIMRSAEALAYYTAAIFVAARGGAGIASDFEAKGDVATDAMTNRQAKLLQRANFRRRPVYDSSGRMGRRSY